MHKKELIERIDENFGTFGNTAVILDALFAEIKEQNEAGQNVYIRDFGSFILKKKKQRIIRKRGKAAIVIPSHYAPCFHPSKTFVNLLNQKTILK